MTKKKSEKEEILEYINCVLKNLAQQKKMVRSLTGCADLFISVIIELVEIKTSININADIFEEAAKSFMQKLGKFKKGFELGEYEQIKVYKEFFPVSKGAVLAKMFYHFTLGNFPGIISLSYGSALKSLSDNDRKIIYNPSLLIILCTILFEFWNKRAKKASLKKICMLVIGFQSQEENLVAIFEFLLGEI